MRILVTWGSTMHGTEGIARILGESLRQAGHHVDVFPTDQAVPAIKSTSYDAAVVGGALYANRWHRDARRFVARCEGELRKMPVWFFSSGPLDDSAARTRIPPIAQVAILMERVGAQGHETFGGRLERDAPGFFARSMAKTHAGDFRSKEQIQAFGAVIARALPTARPDTVVEQPGRSRARLVLHGLVGWVLCALAMSGLLSTTSFGAAFALHAVAAPVVFFAVARHYFRVRGAREPLPTAFAFAGIVLLLDLLVARFVRHDYAMFTSFAGMWLPLALIFSVTWLTGVVSSSMPSPSLTRG